MTDCALFQKSSNTRSIVISECQGARDALLHIDRIWSQLTREEQDTAAIVIEPIKSVPGCYMLGIRWVGNGELTQEAK